MQDPTQIPSDTLPDWLKGALTLIAGGGFVHYLRVWLESRRLGNADFRQTLLDRIVHLEGRLDVQADEIGGLRVKLAREITEKRHLENELSILRLQLDNADPGRKETRDEDS